MEKKSILIVDDEAAVTLALESFFQNKGFQVSRAFYGDQAIEMMDKDRPAVVILDLQMPGIDGIAVLEKIRQSYSGVKTLVITGYGELYQRQLDRLKPDAVKLKPVSLQDLTSEIEILLGQKKAVSSRKQSTGERVRILFVGGEEGLYEQALKPHFENQDRSAPYETAAAHGPQEALLLTEQFHPHFVLLDGNRLPIGVDAGKLAADLSRANTPPLEVIIHTTRMSLKAGEQTLKTQLESIENSIQQAAERHQLRPAPDGGS